MDYTCSGMGMRRGSKCMREDFTAHPASPMPITYGTGLADAPHPPELPPVVPSFLKQFKSIGCSSFICFARGLPDRSPNLSGMIQECRASSEHSSEHIYDPQTKIVGGGG